MQLHPLSTALCLCVLGPVVGAQTALQGKSATGTASPDAFVSPAAVPLAPRATTGSSTNLAFGPTEDDCTTPLGISGAGPFSFDLSMASTGAQGQTNAQCLVGTVMGIANDLWYTWVAPSSGEFSVSTCGQATIDTKIAVYDGSGCPANPAIACADDTCSAAGTQTAVTFTAVATQTYTIQLGVYPGTAVGLGSFGITALPPFPCGSIDDAGAENLGGWTAGGEYCWMQSFGTIGQNFNLSQVEVAWGAVGFPAASPPDGSPAKVAVWEDPNDDGNPADAVLLSLVSTTVANNSSGLYNTINLTSVVSISGVFFVGAGMPHAAGQFAMPMDKNSAGTSLHRAWRFGNNTATPVDYGVFANNLFPPKAIQTISKPFEACVTVRYVCGSTPGIAFCEPGVAGVMTCQCGNPNGPAVGCSNTGSSGGSTTSAGVAGLGLDSADPGSMTLTGVSMLSGSSCIFLQGNALLAAGSTFGAGIRCAGGTLKRLYIKPIVSGSQTAPQAADRSISNRSSDLGDVIAPTSTRWYQIYYRDPSLTNPGGGCPPIATFNITSGQEVLWGP